MKLLKLNYIMMLLAVGLLTACANNSSTEPSDDTATNIIEETTPTNDIPTPANDSLRIESIDTTRK